MKAFTIHLSHEGLHYKTVEDAFSMIRCYCRVCCNDEFFFFENSTKNMVIATIVFNSEMDAEMIAQKFIDVPAVLKEMGFTPGLFYGRPYCITWLVPENEKDA